VGIIQICRMVGMVNPFDWALVLRLLSGGLALWIFYRVSQRLVEDFRRPATTQLVFLGACFLMWFMPFLSVRFSSENWSALALLGGIFLLLTPQKKPWTGPLLTGVLFGLSFWLRFQTAFALLGIGAWILWRRHWPLRDVLIALGGFLASVAVNIVTDCLFYGEWVLTPQRYFQVNLLENKAAEFGLEPWWWYLPETLRMLTYPIGVPLFALFFLGAHLLRKHVLTWAIVPFFIGHSLIGHKELRFLFPMVVPLLFLATAGWEYIYVRSKNISTLKFGWIAATIVWALYNGYWLIQFTPRTAPNPFDMYYIVAQEARKGPLQVYAEPLGPYPVVPRALMPYFYRLPNVSVRLFDNPEMLRDQSIYPMKKGTLLTTTRPDVMLKNIPHAQLKKIMVYEMKKDPKKPDAPVRKMFFYQVE
jgi:GPI mannosyltransferase 3